jgi:uncharacterized protein YbaP (TraB family)
LPEIRDPLSSACKASDAAENEGVRTRSIAWVLLAACFAANAALAAERAPCKGLNLLDKLAATDPARHARILAASDTLENGKAVFWKLEREGRAPSYLFGTVHLTDRRITRLSKEAKNALRGARTLLIENTDFSAAATSSAYASAMKSAVFHDGRSLDQLLSKDEFDNLVRATGGIPPQLLKLYRPWMVSLMLSASTCERDRLRRGHDVLDMVIAKRARAGGTTVSGLESTVDQLGALAAVPDSEQIDILRANIALVGKSEDLRETMVQLYLARRIGALWHLQIALSEQAGVQASAYASFERIIIIERNRKMRDGALPHLEKGGAFIAVGALHLPGPTGLVRLFRDAGYTATPIE